jgi:hypothetical protein
MQKDFPVLCQKLRPGVLVLSDIERIFPFMTAKTRGSKIYPYFSFIVFGEPAALFVLFSSAAPHRTAYSSP